MQELIKEKCEGKENVKMRSHFNDEIREKVIGRFQRGVESNTQPKPRQMDRKERNRNMIRLS